MKKYFLLLFVLFTFPSLGQKQTAKQSGVWLGYLNQTRLSDHWGIWLDLHARRTDFLDRWSTQIIRPGITYYANEQLRFTAGYALAAGSLDKSSEKASDSTMDTAGRTL
jgi:hypothetical protein